MSDYEREYRDAAQGLRDAQYTIQAMEALINEYFRAFGHMPEYQDPKIQKALDRVRDTQRGGW